MLHFYLNVGRNCKSVQLVVKQFEHGYVFSWLLFVYRITELLQKSSVNFGTVLWWGGVLFMD